MLNFPHPQIHSNSLAQLLRNTKRILGDSHQTITLHNKIQNNKCRSVFYGGAFSVKNELSALEIKSEEISTGVF